MSEAIYIFDLRLNAGQLAEPVRELEQSISDHLATMGYEGLGERLKIKVTLPIELKSSRELTDSELQLISSIMRENYAAMGGEVINVRRQSGNVQQSVS